MEVLLLMAGVIGVGIWAWSYVRMAVFQSWGNKELEHRIHGPSATAPPPAAAPQAPPPPAAPQAPPPIRNGALLGRLAIPRLKMRAVVREGAGEDTLDVALGHIPGTALPGQPGNAGIAGHRDTLFRGLRKIAKNDVIEFETPAGSYDYKVESTGIVKPDDVAVLHASQHPEITLVTCYPFYYVGSAPDRFIVKARLVDPPTAPAPAPAPATTAALTPAPAPATTAVLTPAPGAAHGSESSENELSHNEPSHDHKRVIAHKSTNSRGQSALPPVRRVSFEVSVDHGREVVPGIRLGVSWADPARHRASIWMFVTPEGRTISLKDQPARQPVFFHGHDDGRQRELMITQVTANSVTGYLLQYGSSRAGARPLRAQ